MALTAGQQACVDALVGPVAVSAGAGSGKTFTLTKRIVHAVESGFVSDITEVLAITFTTKAAGELKSRIKGALRAAGRIDQALKVDGAWISTIHGMCARMLRAHALELGINPEFTVVGEADRQTMLDASIEDVLGRANDFVSPAGLDALFAEYPARSAGGFGSDSIEDMVRVLVAKANESPAGMGAFVLPPEGEGPYRLLSDLVELAATLADAAEAQKPGNRRDTFLEETREAVERAEAALAKHGLDAHELLTLINAFPVPSKGFGNAEYKARVDDAACRYEAIALEARLALARPLLVDLLHVTGMVFDAFNARKRDAGVLDNDDLLVQTARAFDRSPAVVQAYANKFNLIMVDEFQDTSQMQVDLIKRLAGEGFERLCTVGDAQQSIYRFRGADVSVYNRHLETVREQNPQGLIVLADNFRSCPAVLSFVDRVFSQPTVFGSSFMSLAPGRDESRIRDPFCPASDGPRIEVQLTTYQTTIRAAQGGVSKNEARVTAAARIAQRFAQLAQAGHSAGEMAVLLGNMSHSDMYADALREAGLACVVTGGSIFNRAPEVQLVVRIVQLIANPKDGEALFEVLSSELFALSADDLLILSTGTDDQDGMLKRRDLDRGFVDLARRVGEGHSVSPALESAVRLFEECRRRAGRVPVADLVQRMVTDSGWLARLEAQGAEGQAQAANVYKAIRMVRAVERETGKGSAGVASAFALRVAIAKEAPGALAASGSAFVRIMTVHASKGLEFPIVAVAELREDRVATTRLVSGSVGGSTYLSLDAGRSVSTFGTRSIVTKCTGYQPYSEVPEEDLPAAVLAAHTAADQRSALKRNEAAGEAEESRRLLYVALTRAKEALVLSMLGSSTKKDPTGLSKGCVGDIQSALVGPGEVFGSGTTLLEYGGEEPARVIREDLLRAQATDDDDDAADGESGADDEEADGRNDADSLFDIPVVPCHDELPALPYAPARADVFSYSSLAPDHGVPAADVSPLNDDDAWNAICESLQDTDSATDLGTAFHRLAQLSVNARCGITALKQPCDDRVQALSRACGLSPVQQVRLNAALGRWFSSSLAQRAGRFCTVRAEVPFFVPVAGAGCLEGEIDLLATDGAGVGSALIVDYKTGGSAEETPDQLHEKHLLQATCYAYAVLLQGYDAVEAVFVRVEQPDRSTENDPQQVTYQFTQSDMPALEQAIYTAACAH